MHAVSVKQPYAEAIASGAKPREYRTWAPGTIVGKDLLIVASRTPANGYAGEQEGVAICVVHVNKVVELGFLRRLKPATGSSSAISFEVLRILKAYVDAQWLANFDERLASYRARLESVDGEANDV